MKLLILDDSGNAIELDPAEEGSITTVRMLEVFALCLQLQQRKALTYGEAYRSQGYMGNVARVLSKSARLKKMLWQDSWKQLEDSDESVMDTMLDLINLSAFFIINWMEGNKWGS